MKKSQHLYIGRLAATVVLGAVMAVAPLAAQAAPAGQQLLSRSGSGMELEVSEMELVITEEDPRPRAYLYPSVESGDYYFIVWMSSNPTVASVDGNGKVTGRSEGTATITAIADTGERASCTVTVRMEREKPETEKPALQPGSLSLTLQYNDLNPTAQLELTNNERSYLYVYQWMCSDPEVATVDENGLVTAQGIGTATITALVSNGQALRCSVTVTSDIGRVRLSKNELLLREVGAQETLDATVAVENGDLVPITWVSSNPGVATVDANGVVTAVADGEAKITALSPEGRSDVCSVFVGIAAEKYANEAEAAEELEIPSQYMSIRIGRQRVLASL